VNPATTVNGQTCTLGATCTITTGSTTNQNIRQVVFDFGAFTTGATALSASATACVHVFFAGTIQQATIIATPSGSATVDVRTVALASYTGPASASSITAAAIPAIASAVSYNDTTLTGWTTALAANTEVCAFLSSPLTITGLVLALKVAAN